MAEAANVISFAISALIGYILALAFTIPLRVLFRRLTFNQAMWAWYLLLHVPAIFLFLGFILFFDILPNLRTSAEEWNIEAFYIGILANFMFTLGNEFERKADEEKAKSKEI